jgi:hypothetical protein
MYNVDQRFSKFIAVSNYKIPYYVLIRRMIGHALIESFSTE